jgi:hypothetical protein
MVEPKMPAIPELPNARGWRHGPTMTETGRFIEPDGRVVAATPFVVPPAGGLGLQFRISDGSSLLVLPAIHETEEPEDRGLPKLADWELSSPSGLLSAGPASNGRSNPPGLSRRISAFTSSHPSL